VVQALASPPPPAPAAWPLPGSRSTPLVTAALLVIVVLVVTGALW